MEFDRLTTAIAFIVLVAVGAGAMVATPMDTGTVLMMVLPSMAIFGLIMLALGVKHGEHRASR